MAKPYCCGNCGFGYPNRGVLPFLGGLTLSIRNDDGEVVTTVELCATCRAKLFNKFPRLVETVLEMSERKT